MKLHFASSDIYPKDYDPDKWKLITLYGKFTFDNWMGWINPISFKHLSDILRNVKQ